MSFCFHRDFVATWGNPMISRGLAIFFEFFTLLRYIEGTSWPVYKLSIQIGMALLLFILLNIIFLWFAAKQKIGGLSTSIIILKALLMLLT